MTDFTVITRGPWRIRTSAMGEGEASVSWGIDDQRETVTVESHADLALLRDAITEYLEAVEASRA